MSVEQFLLSANTTDLSHPELRPSLDLNFARVKTLDPRITFTRSSGGSYVGVDGLIKYSGVNEARFDHDPVTGESLGLLIEEARTNLLLRSEEIDDAYWTQFKASIVSNMINAPNGLNVADKLVENGDTDTHSIDRSSISVVSGTTYTLSTFVKAGERNFAQLVFVGQFPTTVSAIFDLKTGQVSAITGSPTITVVPFLDGWWRISITATANATGNTTIGIRVSDRNTTATYGGDGASGIYVWGIQLEDGAFPTSYIPTQASTRTRAADDARITGKNFSDFFNPLEGTVFTDFTNRTTTSGIVLNIDDGGFPNRIQFGNIGGIAYVRSNVTVISNAVPGTFPGPNFRYATSYSNNRYIITRNGVSTILPITTESIGAPPIGLANMRLGSYHNNTDKHNGTISRVIYYPKRLPIEQLQALTS